MGGFSLAEVGPANQDRLWMRGGFPRAWLAPSERWMRSFTFLERPGLGSRVSPDSLGRFDAGALPRTDLERGGIGTLDGRERFSGEPLPRPADGRVLPPWFEASASSSPPRSICACCTCCRKGDRSARAPPVWWRRARARRDRPSGAPNLLLLRRGRRWGFEFKCTDAPRTSRCISSWRTWALSICGCSIPGIGPIRSPTLSRRCPSRT